VLDPGAGLSAITPSAAIQEDPPSNSADGHLQFEHEQSLNSSPREDSAQDGCG